MKKYFFLAAVALMAAACSSDNDMLQTESAVSNPDPTTVTLTFSPYDMEPMNTRAGVVCSSVSPTRGAQTRAAVSDFANKLDIWLYDGDTEVQAVQQEAGQQDFATLALTLDKRKTYTLIAVAHKSSGGHATLQDGIIAWPSDKISQTFFYTHTFSPADVTTLQCQMERIVALFRMETTDVLPSATTRATIDVPQTWTQWNAAALTATAPKDRTVTFSTLSPAQDGTVVLSAYILSTSAEPTAHTLTVTFQDAAGSTVQQRTFTDVPLRNGYKTTYRGSFFVDQAFTATFTVDDWNDYGVTEF